MSDKDDKGQSGKDGQDRNGSETGSDAPRGKLEALLNEWDAKNPKGTDSGDPKSPKEGKTAGTGDEVATRLERLESLVDQTSYRSDMERIVAEVKGDLDIDDDFVEFWVNKRAEGDSRLVELWNQRDANKIQFRKVIEYLAPEFREYVKSKGLVKPDSDPDDPDGGSEAAASNGKGKGKDESRDDKGLGAAVRSSREAKPSTGADDVNWAGLTGQEFALKRAEVFRAVKQGKLK